MGDTMIDQRQEEQEQQLSRDARQFLSLLDRKSKFPLPIHKKISEKIEGIAREFLEDIRKEIHEFLVHSSYQEDEDEDNEERGLDCDLDTEEEVTTMIQFFPSVLTERNEDGTYPIFWQLISPIFATKPMEFNLKSIPFIPLFVELATELRLFEETDRGGLFGEEEEED